MAAGRGWGAVKNLWGGCVSGRPKDLYNHLRTNASHNILSKIQNNNVITFMHHNSNAFAYNFNSFSSMFQSLPEHPHSLATSSSRLKKKYSKVNETIKKEFLSLIIQHNMSIKQVSPTLPRHPTPSTSTIAAPKPYSPTTEKTCTHPNQWTRIAYRHPTRVCCRWRGCW